MPDQDQAIREAAYFIWRHEGCPDGRAEEHWHRAAGQIQDSMGDEEKVVAGRPDANWPALLTKDVKGG